MTKNWLVKKFEIESNAFFMYFNFHPYILDVQFPGFTDLVQTHVKSSLFAQSQIMMMGLIQDGEKRWRFFPHYNRHPTSAKCFWQMGRKRKNWNHVC